MNPIRSAHPIQPSAPKAGSWILVFLLGLGLFCAPVHAEAPETSPLFQYATINSLLQGFYDGQLRMEELATHGTLGLGTFNALDGEMIALDGEFYQIPSTGKVVRVPPTLQTPFAVICRFDDQVPARTIPSGHSYRDLQASLMAMIEKKNLPHAFRMDGLFRTVKTRSVPRQTPPYLPLAEVAAKQATFQFDSVTGTLVGFWIPEYMAGFNVPGFHFHFISRDRTQGGHVLDLTTETVQVQVNELPEFQLTLPTTREFSAVDLTGKHKQDLDKVEKGQ
ncbi:MAG: acetolactate decarboxylase [Magnetococcales bacterium]|nr:acetolactate decarboxylase [Magnetococcales bacterium]